MYKHQHPVCVGLLPKLLAKADVYTLLLPLAMKYWIIKIKKLEKNTGLLR